MGRALDISTVRCMLYHIGWNIKRTILGVMRCIMVVYELEVIRYLDNGSDRSYNELFTTEDKALAQLDGFKSMWQARITEESERHAHFDPGLDDKGIFFIAIHVNEREVY